MDAKVATVYRVRVEREIRPAAPEIAAMLVGGGSVAKDSWRERCAQFVDVRAFGPEDARGAAVEIVGRSKSMPAGRGGLVAVNVEEIRS